MCRRYKKGLTFFFGYDILINRKDTGGVEFVCTGETEKNMRNDPGGGCGQYIQPDGAF